MNNPRGKFVRGIFVLYLVFLHSILFLFVYEKIKSFNAETPVLETSSVEDPLKDKPLTEPIPLPTFSEKPSAPSPENIASPSPTNGEISSDELMIPVVGVKREQLTDTYSDDRSEARVHNAIDIAAPQGTPVVAVADGEIAKFFDSERGGITVYQYNRDKTLIYYYAHLQRRADNLKEKDFVKRGTLIGYVGDTGNAGAGNFHLHFSISRIETPERFWEGENINPFPLLVRGIEAE